MNWPALATVTAISVSIAGCGFFGGDEEDSATTAEESAPAAQTEDTTQLEEAPALEQESTAAPAQQTAAQPSRPAVDRPWTPTHTGTIDPGMTRDQVVAVWGEPMVERSSDEWLYLYFRNGCEVSCGTDDVVLLQNGQVVDAIVRGQGHNYSGVSSSPPGRVAEPTRPSSGETG